MPITYEIDVEQKLVLTTASGTIRDNDIIQHKAQLVGDPNFTSGMKELSDLRHIDGLEVTAKGIEAMVQLDARDSALLARHRLALVVSQTVAFGMARMYQMQTKNSSEVGVFLDLEEAKTWLHLK